MTDFLNGYIVLSLESINLSNQLTMKKIANLFPIIALLILSACNTDDLNVNLAEKIIGTYSISTYTTEAGQSPGDLSANKVVVTRNDNTHVTMIIDYSDPETDDVSATNVLVEENGSAYNFSQSFSNASLLGSVSSSGTMTYNLDYTNENFVNLTAVK